jgi:hypothetical protein
MKLDKIPTVSLSFFSADRSLLGIECEVLNMCDGIRPDKTFIVDRYASLSIGLVVVTLTVNIKLKGDI